MPDTLLVPFHGVDRLEDAAIPLAPAARVQVVEPVLPETEAADLRERPDEPDEGAHGHWPQPSFEALGALHGAVAERVAAALAGALDGRPVAVLSGDCLVSLGVVAGVQRAGLDPAIVWFDAHGDVHTLASTTSGYLGGLTLRMVVGGDPEALTARIGLRPLAEERALLVGARDLDPAEIAYLARARVGTSSVEGLAAGAVAVPPGRLVVHVDLDVLDTAEVGPLLFPAPGGATRDGLVAAVRRLVATGRVAVLDLACTWRPDPAWTARRAALLAELLALLDEAPREPDAG